MKGERFGTLLPAKGNSLASRKRWIGYTKRPRGCYVVDAGAERALRVNGSSLLSVGVSEVRGSFAPGDLVALENPDGREFARGLTNYSAEEVHRIKGLSTRQVAERIPNCRYDEVIHRDNLVLL